MNRILLLTLFITLSSFAGFAQNVGIGVPAAFVSAMNGCDEKIAPHGIGLATALNCFAGFLAPTIYVPLYHSVGYDATYLGIGALMVVFAVLYQVGARARRPRRRGRWRMRPQALDGPRRDPRHFLPHEHDAVLLSEVWSVDALVTCARARAGSANAFVADGEAWPSWLLIELLAQVVAASAGLRDRQAGSRPRLGLLLGVRDFRSAVGTCANGDMLDLSVRESSRDADGTGVYDGEVRVAGACIASATLTVFLPPDADAYLASVEP